MKNYITNFLTIHNFPSACISEITNLADAILSKYAMPPLSDNTETELAKIAEEIHTDVKTLLLLYFIILSKDT